MTLPHVRFSNRPFEVKRFQTIRSPRRRIRKATARWTPKPGFHSADHGSARLDARWGDEGDFAFQQSGEISAAIR